MQSVNRPIQEMAAVTSSVTLDRIAAIVYPPISQADDALDQADAQTNESGHNEQQEQFIGGDGGHELTDPSDTLSDESGDGGQNGGNGRSSLF